MLDPRDVAAVAAETLLSSIHNGLTYTLTGPEPLSVPDQAAILAKLLNRPVVTEDLPPAEAWARLLARGMGTAIVDAIVAGASWARRGHNAVVTEDGSRVPGRAATGFESWARDHLWEFSG